MTDIGIYYPYLAFAMWITLILMFTGGSITRDTLFLGNMMIFMWATLWNHIDRKEKNDG